MGSSGYFYNATEFHNESTDDTLDGFVHRRRFERSIGHIVAPALVTMNSCSLFANVVILVMLFCRGIRSRTAAIIVNLVFNDILLLCIGTPWKLLSYVTDSWPVGTTMCKLTVYSLTLTFHVEVYSLLLLASLRYMAISKPLRAAVILTNIRVYILLAGVWVSATCINIPVAKFATVASLTYDNMTFISCVRMHARNVSLTEQIYGKCHFVLTYILPLVVILVLTLASIRELNTTSSYIIGGTTNNDKRNHAVHRLVALTITYAVCVLPINIVFMLRFLVGDSSMHSKEFVIVEVCALFVAFLKCSIHPLVYNCMTEDSRKYVRKLLRRENTCSSHYSQRCNVDFDSRHGTVYLENVGMLANILP